MITSQGVAAGRNVSQTPRLAARGIRPVSALPGVVLVEIVLIVVADVGVAEPPGSAGAFAGICGDYSSEGVLPVELVMWTSQGGSVDSEGGFGWVDGCGRDVGFGFVQPQVAGVGRDAAGETRAGRCSRSPGLAWMVAPGTDIDRVIQRVITLSAVSSA